MRKRKASTFKISKREKRSAMALASIFALRMLGLFMILPIFSLSVDHLSGVTPFLIGIALGAYGVASGFLQAPLGWLSDKIGRKTVIVIGLVLFIIGSLVAGHSTSIDGIIVGRVLQGIGAIGSTVLALAADLTREEVRTKAMAMIGITIGMSFVLAMVVGPILNTYIGLSGIFYLTAVLAFLGILVVVFVVPTPEKSVFHREQEMQAGKIKEVLKNKELLRLDFGVFMLHAILMAMFVVLPLTLLHEANLPVNEQWYVYLPVLLVSFVLMVPLVIIAESFRQMKRVFTGAIFAIAIAELLLFSYDKHVWGFAISLLIFFTAFILLEATLPSLISKTAPITSKGTAVGIYSSSQFFGAFVGGLFGGWLYATHHPRDVYLMCLVGAILWFISAMNMKIPPALATKMLQVGKLTEKQAKTLEGKLKKLAGVAVAIVVAEDQTAYLKVDSRIIDETALMAFSKAKKED